jgi:hypothetical protein
MVESFTNGLVLDRRVVGKPGAHALIIGVDDYPFLDGNTALGESNFELPKLTSATRSALAFHDWLMNKARLPVPLFTSRLLLSASPNEQDVTSFPSNWAPANTEDLVRAATGWIRDARGSAEDMTVFYFCGHKLQISRDDDILLCGDFGSPFGPSFRGGISFANIFNGMGSVDGPIAQTQIYFLDGSRHPVSRQLLGTRISGTTNIFDVLPSGPDRRAAGVFHAAAPGEQAYAPTNDVSLFSQAVIKGLEGGAAVPQLPTAQSDDEWAVTISSLSRWMGAEGERLSAEYSITISFNTSLAGDGVIATVAKAPKVNVEIQVKPTAAAAEFDLTIEDELGETVVAVSDLLPTYKLELIAGVYALTMTAKPDSGAKSIRRLVQVMPPNTMIIVDAAK